jgi:hypothetical protein
MIVLNFAAPHIFLLFQIHMYFAPYALSNLVDIWCTIIILFLCVFSVFYLPILCNKCAEHVLFWFHSLFFILFYFLLLLLLLFFNAKHCYMLCLVFTLLCIPYGCCEFLFVDHCSTGKKGKIQKQTKNPTPKRWKETGMLVIRKFEKHKFLVQGSKIETIKLPYGLSLKNYSKNLLNRSPNLKTMISN